MYDALDLEANQLSLLHVKLIYGNVTFLCSSFVQLYIIAACFSPVVLSALWHFHSIIFYSILSLLY